MLYLICYDIVKARNRRRLANVLLDHGTRVQKSAFECDLATEARLRVLVASARRCLDPQTDTLRIYRVCASCREEALALGLNHSRPVLSTVIV